MQEALALFGYHLGNPCPARFKVVNDVFHFIQLPAIFKNRVAYAPAQRIPFSIGCEGIIFIVDNDLLGIQLNFAIYNFGIAIEPNNLAVNAAVDGVSGRIIDSGFDVALGSSFGSIGWCLSGI